MLDGDLTREQSDLGSMGLVRLLLKVGEASGELHTF
jgi:hypothetical protein